MDTEEVDFDMLLDAEDDWRADMECGPFSGPHDDDAAGGDADAAVLQDAEIDVEHRSAQGVVDLPVRADEDWADDAGVEDNAPVEPVATSANRTPGGGPRVSSTPVESMGVARPIARRLVGKQRVPHRCARLLPLQPKHGDFFWGSLSYSEFCKLAPRGQYFRVFNKFRWWCTNTRERLDNPELCSTDQPESVKLVKRACMDFKMLSPIDKCKAFKLFALNTEAPDHIVRWIERMYPNVAVADSSPGYYLYARSVLFTWNGDWGLFTDTGLERRMCWRQVVAFLKGNDRFKELWQDFKVFVEGLSDVLCASAHAFSLEMCPDSWSEDGVVRVHGHAYFNSDRVKMRLSRHSHASFKNALPNKSHRVAALNHRNCSGWAGCYYLMAPKIGVVLCCGSLRPYKDFGVTPEWIMNLVQAEKWNSRML